MVATAWVFSRRRGRSRESDDGDDDGVVGILAFEAASVMSRMVSLHRALSEEEVHRLRSDTMRSPGVAYLNSTSQPFLLRLACAELVAELDRASAAFVRLELRTKRGGGGGGFARFYNELKAGGGAEMPAMSKKSVERRVKKMERLVAATSRLYDEMEHLEAAKKKLNKQWSSYSGPIPAQRQPKPPLQNPNAATYENLVDELNQQTQKVRRLKLESLWSQQVSDKLIALVIPVVVFVFARICAVFGPIMPGLPPVIVSGGTMRFARDRRINNKMQEGRLCSSGPIRSRREIAISGGGTGSNSCPIFRSEEPVDVDWNGVLRPPENTLGASGMAVRYAEVVDLADKLLRMRRRRRSAPAPEEEKEETRLKEEIYEKLPASARAAVAAKMRECRVDGGMRRRLGDRRMAEGWEEAVEGMMTWLWEVADDTLTWQAARSLDRRWWFETPLTAAPPLMMQTMYFSDAVKAEAAVVEVLVGLSCMYRYDG